MRFFERPIWLKDDLGNVQEAMEGIGANLGVARRKKPM